MRGPYRSSPSARARRSRQVKRLSVINVLRASEKCLWRSHGQTDFYGAAIQSRGFQSIPVTIRQRNFCSTHPLQCARKGAGSLAIDPTLETSLISPQPIVATFINGLAEIEEVRLFLEDFLWVRDPIIEDAAGLPAQNHVRDRLDAVVFRS